MQMLTVTCTVRIVWITELVFQKRTFWAALFFPHCTQLSKQARNDFKFIGLFGFSIIKSEDNILSEIFFLEVIGLETIFKI